jgi:hypothetical protein
LPVKALVLLSATQLTYFQPAGAMVETGAGVLDVAWVLEEDDETDMGVLLLLKSDRRHVPL